MAVIYFVITVIFLALNAGGLPGAISQVFTGAFSGTAAAGGFAGAGVMLAMRSGIARGLFSNESGLGSAPIVAAAAKTKWPAEQGLISMTGTFIDTIIICTLTGLTIIVSGQWLGDTNGAELTQNAFAVTYGGFAPILLAVALIGWGSSIFHPESSRVAQLASGGRKGLAQSIFQVGGNAGSAFGPLLAALVVIPYGQTSIMWFAPAALLAIGILLRIGNWYKRQLNAATAAPVTATAAAAELPRRKIHRALLILAVLVFSKYFYIACMTNYFTFFLMDKFAFSVQDAQYSLFAFLAASAAGTVIGGPLGDRIGRKYVIWGSILGAAPFALMLSYAGSGGAVALAILVGLIISSAFSAIVVYATDLMPGRVGMIAGLFFGLMFGLGGLGSAFFGWLADRTSIEFIFRVSALLPLMGIITGFLPDVERKR